MNFIYDLEQLKEIKETYLKLPERVKETFSASVVHYMQELLFNIEDCQSPIEQLMGLCLTETLKLQLVPSVRDFFVTPQETIEVNGSKYRVDFFVAVETKSREHVGFVIECDGHDFHEKTKEQAKKDKKRDRDLQSLGYKVIRFTGSEIHKCPAMCAREASNIVRNEILRRYKEVN